MKHLKLNSLILIIHILTTLFVAKGQHTNKFLEIDELLKTNSMIDAMTALNKLKNQYQKDTIDSEYWSRYSKASYTFYKYNDAKLAINKAIVINPNNSVYYFEKGILLNKLGYIDSALVSLETAVKIKPEGEYFYWKGILNQQLNKLKEAEHDYNSAILKNFETAELHNNFAILLIANEKFESALSHINRAIQLNEKYSQAFSARSKLYVYLLNIDSACTDRNTAYNLGYKRVFDIPDSVCNGTFASKMKFAGDLCAGSHYYNQAIKAYSLLIDRHLIHSDYYLNRGYCYYKLKEYTKAEKDYLDALLLPHASKDLLYENLSILYFDTENFTKSIEYSSKRIKLDPNNHVPYIDRGLCYRKLKKYKEAEKDFDTSLNLKPDFFRAFGYRSFLFLELGQYEKSFQDATKAVQINPKYAYGYIVLGQAKQKLGMQDFCVDFYTAKKFGEPDADIAIKEYCK